MKLLFKQKCVLIMLTVFLVGIPFTVAGDNGITAEITSDYIVIPDGGMVHVTKQILFSNTDTNTKYKRGYYSTFNHYLPSDAVNVKAYDDEKVLGVRNEQGSYHTFLFNNRVWYGDNYVFYIEYDLPINKNTAVFYIMENGDSTHVRVEVPSGFDTHLARDDYELEEEQYASVYTFRRGTDWGRSCLVNAVRHTDYLVLSDVVRLQERNVTVNIRYWDGEEEWAQEMLDTALTSLPILEETWGIPYPASYDITITQANINETGGYGGFNKGREGIWMLHTSSSEILIHELAHYWTRACNFDQLWMDEGYADLYTYIVLNETDPASAADRKDRFLQKYESLKDDYDFPLSGWDIPENIDASTGMKVDFGYKKAFALSYELYEGIGLENMKDSNIEFAASSAEVNEEMFLSILSVSSGSDLQGIRSYIY